MKWRRLGDVGLWAALSFLVLAESGARHDPYWFRAVCLAVLAFAAFGRRWWPLVALGVVAWTEIVVLAFALGTTNGVQIALVPAISLLSAVLLRLGVKNRVQAAIVAYEAGLVAA
jgi:hypothetical protein